MKVPSRVPTANISATNAYASSSYTATYHTARRNDDFRTFYRWERNSCIGVFNEIDGGELPKWAHDALSKILQ
jgi:hypothetical protein